MHSDENEKQTVGQEVVLVPTLVQKLIVLARSLIDLDWSHMDGFVTDESACKPECREEIVAKKLNQKLE